MSSKTAILNPKGIVQHRKARAGRKGDSIVALDMFSGCGGSSQGIEAAGIDVWYAANHWEYAVELHEANHPKAEHFIADLVDEEAGDYYHPESLPRADVLWASPSCTNHSSANSSRAYELNLPLPGFEDADYEANVTNSERSRSTAVCVLQYARKHHPKVIIVENVVEFAAWGVQQGNAKRGDGSTFRWWLDEFGKLGYDHKVLFLNSQFFPPCPQSRDRMYVAFWDRKLRKPDLDFRPEAWCSRCDGPVNARQTWKQRTKAWPLPQWGKYEDQYTYTCPSCLTRVYPVAWPAATAIDWSDLGQRIGDRSTPLAESTMARIARGVEKFGHWPPLMIPAKALYGSDKTVASPLATFTGQQERMLVNAFQVVTAGHTFEHPGSNCRTRGMDKPMWSQHTTPAFGFVAHPDQLMPMIHTARGSHPGRAACLSPVDGALPIVTAGGNHHFLLTPTIFAKQNGGPADTAWHRADEDPLNTLLGRDTTCIVSPGSEIRPVAVEDCLYRMLNPDEIRTGMGIDREFKLWGTARDKVRALGNAVTPPVSKWVCEQLVAVLR